LWRTQLTRTALEIDQKRLLLKPNADIEVAAVNADIATDALGIPAGIACHPCLDDIRRRCFVRASWVTAKGMRGGVGVPSTVLGRLADETEAEAVESTNSTTRRRIIEAQREESKAFAIARSAILKALERYGMRLADHVGQPIYTGLCCMSRDGGRRGGDCCSQQKRRRGAHAGHAVVEQLIIFEKLRQGVDCDRWVREAPEYAAMFAATGE
jgi:hypothetical protein